ncbi:MAG TPA: hypothetical protein VN758_10160 [Solirubrobacterales bacterium]|nr:hypothetical protein [Solirubrobacterales bacterium]
MLAYVFWHQPRRDINHLKYEEAQRAFHGALELPSACFRVSELPFDEKGGGYEDWYLVEDWGKLGELNSAAVDSIRRADHDRAASQAADGWGAVYSLARGPTSIPEGARWLDKPRGTPTDQFLASLAAATVWRRQMVLGPGPEFCAVSPGSAGREKIWPGDF